jgi:hypothetical protein
VGGKFGLGARPSLARLYARPTHARPRQGTREKRAQRGSSVCEPGIRSGQKETACPAPSKDVGLPRLLLGMMVGDQRRGSAALLLACDRMAGCLLSVACRGCLRNSSAHPQYKLQCRFGPIPGVAYPWSDAERVMAWSVPKTSCCLLTRRTGGNFRSSAPFANNLFTPLPTAPLLLLLAARRKRRGWKR